jgi:hypothetical protein
MKLSDKIRKNTKLDYFKDIEKVDPDYIINIYDTYKPRSVEDFNSSLLDDIDKMVITLSNDKNVKDFVKKNNIKF